MKKQKTCIVQPKFKQPNPFYYFILWAASLWGKHHFHMNFDKKQLKAVRKIKGPVLVIASHHGPVDFAAVTYAMYPKRLSIVTASNLFYHEKFGALIRRFASCIPKKQFTTDYTSVKNIKKMLDAGVSVLVYPEGRFSIAGKNGRMSDTIFRLIKWLKVPVVFMQSHACYHILPKYATDFRVGRMDVHCETLFTAEECEKLDIASVQEKVKQRFAFNDYDYQQEHHIAYYGKNGATHQMEYLLYKCPACGAEFCHKTYDKYMECEVCGNKIEMDEYSVIRPIGNAAFFERPDYWYDWQYSELKKEIEANPDYRLSHEVDFSIADDAICGYRFVEKGVLSLDKTGFSYKGENSPEMKFPIPNPPSLPIDLPYHIDIYDREDNLYRFDFMGKEKPIKINMAVEIISDLYPEKKA